MFLHQRDAHDDLLECLRAVYGRTTGVGANRDEHVGEDAEPADTVGSAGLTGSAGHGLRLLRSHSGGAGDQLDRLATGELPVGPHRLAPGHPDDVGDRGDLADELHGRGATADDQHPPPGLVHAFALALDLASPLLIATAISAATAHREQCETEAEVMSWMPGMPGWENAAERLYRITSVSGNSVAWVCPEIGGNTVAYAVQVGDRLGRGQEQRAGEHLERG